MTPSVTAGVPCAPIPTRLARWQELDSCWLAAAWLPACGSRRAPNPPAAAPTTSAPTRATTSLAPTTTRPPPPLAPLTGLLQPHAVAAARPGRGGQDRQRRRRPPPDRRQPGRRGVRRTGRGWPHPPGGGVPVPVPGCRRARFAPAGSPTRRSPTTSTTRSSPIPAPMPGFCPILRSQPVTDVDGDNRPDLFWRSNLAAAPDNLYASVVSLAGASTTHAPPGPLLSFLTAGATFGGPGAAPAGRININFAAASVTWDWSDSLRAWAPEPERHRRTSTGPGCSSTPPMSSFSSSRTSPRGWPPERAFRPLRYRPASSWAGGQPGI